MAASPALRRGGDGCEEAETLRALRPRRFAGTTEQRLAAIDVARRMLAGLLALPWSPIAVNNLDGRRDEDWLAAVSLIALVGCAVGVVLAHRRVVQLDCWENRRTARGSTPATPELA